MAATEKEEQEEEDEEAACASAAAAGGDGKVVVPPLMELCDELWFFRNALGRDDGRPAPGAALPLSPEEEVAAATAIKESSVKEGSPRAARSRLLRAPSMPAYRTRPADGSGEAPVCSPRKLAGGTTGGATGGGRGVRRRSLAKAGSLPAAYCDGEEGAATAQIEGDGDCPRAARSSKLQRSSSSVCPTANPSAPPSTSRLRQKHFASQAHLFVEANYRTYSVHGRKWRSHSDLESFEVQGFKDLGFVFDAGGASHLASFIPGLREKRPSDDDEAAAAAADAGGRRPRPYLSEAWSVERSAAAPAPKLEWPPAERRSAAEMREQLRFWARAVACNVRQES